MNAVIKKELKERFEATARAHLKLWDAANPKPVAPAVETVRDELRAGKFTVTAGEVQLNPKYDSLEGWETVEFLEVVTTPGLEFFKEELAKHKARREAFVSLLDTVHNRYLDRALFDNETPFVMLNGFHQWDRTDGTLPGEWA